MEKQLGKWLAVGTFGLGAIYTVIKAIVAFAAGVGVATVPALLSTIIVGLIFQGFVILYFFASKRVKETLIK
jgi:hypothetical protein